MRSAVRLRFVMTAAGALLSFSAPSIASPMEHDPTTTSATSAEASTRIAPKSAQGIDAVMGMIDKMFPPQPDPDPTRLVLARTAVQSMWPDGAYAKMMRTMVGSVFNGLVQAKEAKLSPAAPTHDHAQSNTSAGAPHEQAGARDPHFVERMRATKDVIDEEIGKLSVVVDPRIREGLARSMARRFDAHQLSDINAFFATPSGRALASEYVQLWFEPDTLRSMMDVVPEMVKLMPDASRKLKAVNERFPKPTPPERPGKKS